MFYFIQILNLVPFLNCLFCSCILCFHFIISILGFEAECFDVSWLEHTNYLIKSIASVIRHKCINYALTCFYFGNGASILPISDLQISVFSYYYDSILFGLLKFSILIVLWYLLKFDNFRHTVNRFSFPFVFFRLIKCNRPFVGAHHNTFANPAQRCGIAYYFSIVK